jgi:hypothetical protein
MLALLILSCVLATSIHLGTAADHDRRLDVRECLSKGFDPVRLACSTCDLLPQPDDCQKCCQSYLAAKRRTNPYQAAVLVKSTTTRQHFPNELDRLLEDNDEWEKIRNEKGGDKRLQAITRTSQPTTEKDLVSLFIRHPPPMEVLLLDETLPSGTLSYEKLKEKATEIISLQGLSKDDIKDLLMTLLP